MFCLYLLDEICSIRSNKNINNSNIRWWAIILFEKALFVCKKIKNNLQFDHLIELSEYKLSDRNSMQEAVTPSSANINQIFSFLIPTNLEQNASLNLNHIREPAKNYTLTFKVKKNLLLFLDFYLV